MIFVRLLLLLAVLLPGAGAAQEAEPTPAKNRLIFKPGELQPEPTPEAIGNPVGKTVIQSDKQDPLERKIDLFFLALGAEEVELAYDTLVRNTIIADRPEQVDLLKRKTRETIDEYGPLEGYELISEKRAGQRLVLRTYLSHNAVLPLRWRMYFYQTGGEWKLVDFRVDDGLFELFGEEEGRGAQ